MKNAVTSFLCCASFLVFQPTIAQANSQPKQMLEEGMVYKVAYETCKVELDYINDPNSTPEGVKQLIKDHFEFLVKFYKELGHSEEVAIATATTVMKLIQYSLNEHGSCSFLAR